MRTAVQTNDSGVVDHLRVHHECIPGVHDLVVAVVGIRKHRRPGGEKRQTLILKPRVLGARGVLHPVDTLALALGRGGRQRGNAAIRRIGDDRRAERLDGAGPELAVDRIVGAGAGAFRGRLRRRLLIAFSDLAFPRRRFFRREKGFVLQLNGAFEWRDRRGVPDAVEAGVGVGLAAGSRGERTNPAERRNQQQRCSWNHRSCPLMGSRRGTADAARPARATS